MSVIKFGRIAAINDNERQDWRVTEGPAIGIAPEFELSHIHP
jgi:hypothetical protein